MPNLKNSEQSDEKVDRQASVRSYSKSVSRPKKESFVLVSICPMSRMKILAGNYKSGMGSGRA